MLTNIEGVHQMHLPTSLLVQLEICGVHRITTDGVALVGLVSCRRLDGNQVSAIPSDAFRGLTSLQQL